jgi:formamidopyrimidine-DNA glycosylase
MPELPDVEGFRRVLAEHTGEPIKAVRVFDSGVLRGINARRLADTLRGRRFDEPRRHGKWLIAPLGGPVLVLRFGMTGSLSWQAPDRPRHRHDRLVCSLAEGELRYRDMRKLQGVRLVDSEAQADRMLGDLGPDALDVSRERFGEVLAHRRGRLKSALTDQSVLAGLGNLLADEICWRGRISPLRAVKDLDDADRRTMYQSMRRVLHASIRAGRVPPRDSWLTGARDKPDATCPRCGAPLAGKRVSGRRTVWCPHCQPA